MYWMRLVRNRILLLLCRYLPLSHAIWSNPVFIWVLEVKNTNLIWNPYPGIESKGITSTEGWTRMSYTGLSNNCSKWKISIRQELISVCPENFSDTKTASWAQCWAADDTHLRVSQFCRRGVQLWIWTSVTTSNKGALHVLFPGSRNGYLANGYTKITNVLKDEE